MRSRRVLPHCRCADARRWLPTGSTAAVRPSPTVRLTGTLTGLNLSTSAPEIYYAFAEATAFATKHILDHMRDNGVRIDRLIGVGGIAQKSPFVMQLLADTTGMRIDVSDCKQAGAMGGGGPRGYHRGTLPFGHQSAAGALRPRVAQLRARRVAAGSAERTLCPLPRRGRLHPND